MPAKRERLSLYDFNIHKMDDDWRGWIRYIRSEDISAPDIVLLQDVEHDADRAVFQNALGEAFGGDWSGRGSDPAWQVAVVWRSRRFSQVEHRVWRGFGGTNCTDDSQDAPAIQVKLHDDVAGKWVSVVSLKTPPKVPDDCVWKNIQKVDRNFEPPWGGAVCVIGTDANSPDRNESGRWAGWYGRTIRSERAKLTAAGSLGFCDPVADVCGHDETLLAEHRTLAKSRIDFLLLRTGDRKAPEVVRQKTLPHGSPKGPKWSDHRSVHAEIAY